MALHSGGIDGHGAEVSVYDPILDRAAPVDVSGRAPDELSLEVEATDYPRLLVVDRR